MRDIIERFRYRFELWQRERREDLLGVPRTEPLGHPPTKWDDPKYQAILTESTPKFVCRVLVVYVTMTLIAAQVGGLLARFVPSSRYPLLVALIIFVCGWTLLSIFVIFNLARARKRRRGHLTAQSS